MEGELMDRAETIKDFKSFFNANCEKLREVTIAIKDLPADDEWVLDDEWDEIYKQEVIRDGKV